VATVTLALLVAMACAFGPWHGTFGFGLMSLRLTSFVVVLAGAYLAAAQLVKHKAQTPD
jgi:hypothetical protein